MSFATTRPLRRALQIALLWTLVEAPSARATILVLVPAGEPSAVLESIAAGVRETTDDIEVRPVESDGTISAREGVGADHDAVIVLGRTLLDGSDIATGDVPVLLGGFTGAPENRRGLPYISLNVDPAYVVEQIEKTGPPIVRIQSVLPPDAIAAPEVSTLVSLKEIATKAIAFANGERATARAWFDVLESADGAGDVLWILDDRYLDASGTYRYLTERAWRRDLLVISTIPSYARRGVAVGFVPDLAAYGALLVRSAQRMIDDPEYVPDPLLGAGTVQRVFNRRTLEHVGRRLPSDLDRTGRIDIVIE